MKFVSTRGKAPSLTFSEALSQSLATDGGLYVPEIFPSFNVSDFDETYELSEIAEKLLSPFFQGDVLEVQLPGICTRALNFETPLKQINIDTALLELFHGPTAAFKDVGARFLAECISQQKTSLKRTVLVATSGDTGGAVAAAFFKKPDLDVVVLYPKGKISPRQEKQLTTWGENVRALAVRGNFDDCQKIVKEAFNDTTWSKQHPLLSANSINIGRILPQMVYYAYASLAYLRKTGRQAGFIIPTGNLGNAVACAWAKKVGLPIREIILAVNANQTIPEYIKTGVYTPHATIATLANAMDVGNPSNMERLTHLYSDIRDLRNDISSVSVSDFEISKTIQSGVKTFGEIFCPHTATAAFVREQIRSHDWVIVATAHPAKFETIVEPLIHQEIQVPASLQNILSKTPRITEIEPTLEALKAIF